MQPWYLRPEALQVLDDAARNHPAVVRHFDRYTQTVDEWTGYDSRDARVIRLGRIHCAAVTPILDECELTRDERTRLADDVGLSVTVTMAIDAATGRDVGGSTCYYRDDVARVAAQIAGADRARAAA